MKGREGLGRRMGQEHGGLPPARQGCRGVSCRSIRVDPSRLILVLQSPKFPCFIKSDQRRNWVHLAPGLVMAGCPLPGVCVALCVVLDFVLPLLVSIAPPLSL